MWHLIIAFGWALLTTVVLLQSREPLDFTTAATASHSAGRLLFAYGPTVALLFWYWRLRRIIRDQRGR